MSEEEFVALPSYARVIDVRLYEKRLVVRVKLDNYFEQTKLFDFFEEHLADSVVELAETDYSKVFDIKVEV